MEGEDALYAAIAAGGSHIGEFYEELSCMGHSAEKIRLGVEAARVQLYLSSNIHGAEHELEQPAFARCD